MLLRVSSDEIIWSGLYIRSFNIASMGQMDWKGINIEVRRPVQRLLYVIKQSGGVGLKCMDEIVTMC